MYILNHCLSPRLRLFSLYKTISILFEFAVAFGSDSKISEKLVVGGGEDLSMVNKLVLDVSPSKMYGMRVFGCVLISFCPSIRGEDTIETSGNAYGL